MISHPKTSCLFKSILSQSFVHNKSKILLTFPYSTHQIEFFDESQLYHHREIKFILMENCFRNLGFINHVNSAEKTTSVFIHVCLFHQNLTNLAFTNAIQSTQSLFSGDKEVKTPFRPEKDPKEIVTGSYPIIRLFSKRLSYNFTVFNYL